MQIFVQCYVGHLGFSHYHIGIECLSQANFDENIFFISINISYDHQVLSLSRQSANKLQWDHFHAVLRWPYWIFSFIKSYQLTRKTVESLMKFPFQRIPVNLWNFVAVNSKLYWSKHYNQPHVSINCRGGGARQPGNTIALICQETVDNIIFFIIYDRLTVYPSRNEGP